MNTRVGDVVTFYSYKGGVGRTFALADVAVRLARWGYRVLALDWDLEAPGLHAYLDVPPGLGVVDMVGRLADGNSDTDGLIRPSPLVDGRLDVVAAGTLDTAYRKQVERLDWAALYADGFGLRLEALRTVWKQRYDVILIDSRTGLSDSGGVSTIQLPDFIVALFTANSQSIDGVFDAVMRARGAQSRLPIGRARLQVIPVQTRVDFSEYEAQGRWRDVIAARFAPLVEEWSGENAGVREVLDALAVPYVPFWSYGERLPALASAPPSKLDVGDAHENLAALLARQLEAPADLVRGRADYIESACREAEGAPAAGARSVMLLYAWEDVAFARGLATALAENGLTLVGAPPPVGVITQDRHVLPDEEADYVMIVGATVDGPLRRAADQLAHRVASLSALEASGEIREWRIVRVVRPRAVATWLPPVLAGTPAVSEARANGGLGREVAALLRRTPG